VRLNNFSARRHVGLLASEAIWRHHLKARRHRAIALYTLNLTAPIVNGT
jgi:hypothetical protein